MSGWGRGRWDGFSQGVSVGGHQNSVLVDGDPPTHLSVYEEHVSTVSHGAPPPFLPSGATLK